MLLIWRGWGIAVPFIAFGIELLVEMLFSRLTGDPHFLRTHGWVWLIGMSLSAAAVWMLGCWLARKPGRVVIDKASAQEYEIRARHDLFWIPVKWWAVPLVILGALFAAG